MNLVPNLGNIRFEYEISSLTLTLSIEIHDNFVN